MQTYQPVCRQRYKLLYCTEEVVLISVLLQYCLNTIVHGSCFVIILNCKFYYCVTCKGLSFQERVFSTFVPNNIILVAPALYPLSQRRRNISCCVYTRRRKHIQCSFTLFQTITSGMMKLPKQLCEPLFASDLCASPQMPLPSVCLALLYY